MPPVPRYVRLLCWAVPMLVGGVLGLTVAFSDGIFAGSHDAYGTVAIGSSQTLHLPAGRARLYSQERRFYGTSADTASTPIGISVSVAPVTGGQPLTLHHLVPTETHTTNLGWVTYRSFTVPRAGDYRVTVADPDHNGDADHAITVGKGAWAPLPPPVLGGMIFALFVLLGALANVVATRVAVAWHRRHPVGRGSAVCEGLDTAGGT